MYNFWWNIPFVMNWVFSVIFVVSKKQKLKWFFRTVEISSMVCLLLKASLFHRRRACFTDGEHGYELLFKEGNIGWQFTLCVAVSHFSWGHLPMLVTLVCLASSLDTGKRIYTHCVCCVMAKWGYNLNYDIPYFIHGISSFAVLK